jgi:hypothetical protein
MSYKPVVIKKDPIKERLNELKAKPIMTIPELTEAIKKLMEFAGIK